MRAVRMMVLAAAAWLSVPAAAVLAAASPRVYVADEGSDSESVIDVASRTRVAVVEVGESPHNVQVSPDGTLAWATNDGARGTDEAHKTMSSGEHGDMKDRGEVWATDTATDTVVGKVQVGKHPTHVVVGPDGRYAFVSLSQENAVAVIDPKVRKVVRRIGVASGPIQVYATPDSRLLFVANQGSRKAPGRTVSVIDVGRLAVARTIETGSGAHGVAVSGDGRYAYVTNIYAGTLSILDVARLEVAATVPVGEEPNGVSVTP